jgi:exonuclease III
MWLHLRIKNQVFLVGTCYRQQKGDYTKHFWEKLQESLQLARQTGIRNIILTGDFNAFEGTNVTASKALKSFLDTNALYPNT